MTTTLRPTDILIAARAAGLKSNSHHTQLKKLFKETTGVPATPSDMEGLRSALKLEEDRDDQTIVVEQEQPVQTSSEPTNSGSGAEAKQAEPKSKRIGKDHKNAEQYHLDVLQERYPHVVEVAKTNEDGKILRVVIKCQDPQTKQGADKQQVSVCQTTREIAIQDLFQVTRCVACQERIIRLARRTRAKGKAKAEKARLQAAR